MVKISATEFCAAIRRYCNEGHDIVTAHDMQIALAKRPVQGTTAAVFCVNEENKTLKMKKIANYSSLHNFEFTPDGLRVWKAYNIGNGKLCIENHDDQNEQNLSP